jgi:site-specific recombinase XerD
MGRWRPLLITATFTGLRASELRGLRWSDVDLKANEVHVRQRADRYKKIGKPKSAAGERVVPFGKFVANTCGIGSCLPPRRSCVSQQPAEHSVIVAHGLIPAQLAAGITVNGKAK